jgi:hypothetical protein
MLDFGVKGIPRLTEFVPLRCRMACEQRDSMTNQVVTYQEGTPGNALFDFSLRRKQQQDPYSNSSAKLKET